MTSDISTARTFPPALAANIDKMPVPHPKSKTFLFSNRGLFFSMASL